MHTFRGAPRPPRPGMLPKRGRACGFGTMLIWPWVVMVTVGGGSVLDDMAVTDVDGVATRNHIPMAFRAALKPPPPPPPEADLRSSTMHDLSCGEM